MTIAANSKKTKGRKKNRSSAPRAAVEDPMKALKAIIEEEMARREGIASPKPEQKGPVAAPATPKAAPVKTPAPKAEPTKAAPTKAAPTAKIAAPKTTPSVKAEPQAKPSMTTNAPSSLPTVQAPDFALMTAQIMQIAERSHKMLNAFLARNKTLIDRFPSADPAHLGEAFLDFTSRILAHPDRLVETHLAFMQDYVRLLQATVARMAGQEAEAVIATDPADRRFKDEGWQELWLFDFIKQSYLLFARWAMSLVEHTEGLDPKIAHKISFYTRQVIDAMSPSNFWMTNPEVLRTTLETGGENLIKGLENMLDDLERGHGQLLISMSDNSAFSFGDNIALTPGKVVYQNELMQLLQYAPSTETVHKTPMLIVPPWINKFYILDMRPENSFIKYLVDQGHTVFCISWINPDHRHAKMSFDDYMMLGPIAAMGEVSKITKEKSINCIGYCIGGTLLASTLAWMEAAGSKKPKDLPTVSSATYLVSLIDFAEPGDLGVFIDEDQIAMLESLMADQGYLAAPLMSTSFSMLRANDLIWSFVVNNYLMGREPFPFDLLTWNSDSTNLPAAMQSYYLRNMYLENKLIKPDALTMKDVPIDLRKIKTPSFCLSTHDDHITPWRSTYVATQTYSGPVTFCLSGSGHIAGVVNPPAKGKYGYWINSQCPANADDWLKAAQKHDGSWWPEWIKWLDQYAGEQVAPRDPALNENVIEDAPGSYVRVRVM